MDDLIPTAQLKLRGLGSREIAERIASGDLTRVMRGQYVQTPLDARALHLQRARSCAGQVLALETAAMVHGLPITRLPELVQVVQQGAGRSRTRTIKRVLSAPLPAQHVTEVDGLLLTTLPRTVVDLARVRGLEPGMIAWEAARWRARVAEALTAFDAEAADVIEALRGRKGLRHAQVALVRASAMSQSPMETRSLMRMRTLGIPEPVQQYEVLDPGGTSLGFTDFAWPDLGVLGEYDGQDKYDLLARPGETPAAVMRREKRRQERMESLGWVFARWGKEEVGRPPALRERIDRAFAIAARRSGPAMYVGGR
ncbi:hypothetical protein ACQB6R_12105 [Propionibacteriaceae bacterium G1746]|uniref:hypothetical protein n=1 Tax=Aestuariimicrobium sp. G57 TaxID=3418485 RepID=UPI003C19DCE7